MISNESQQIFRAYQDVRKNSFPTPAVNKSIIQIYKEVSTEEVQVESAKLPVKNVVDTIDNISILVLSEDNKQIYLLQDPNKPDQPVAILEVLNNLEVTRITGSNKQKVAERYWNACNKFITKNKFIITKGSENIGLVKWKDKFLLEDSDEFKSLFNDEIFPLQKQKIVEIFKRSKNGTIQGDIDLANLALKELPDFSSLAVEGNFDCSNNRLASLKGSPKTVTGKFAYSNNQLLSLEDAPFLVGEGVIQQNTGKFSSKALSTVDTDSIDIVKKLLSALVQEQ